MIDSKVLEILERTDALRSGHFLLSSGLHSDRYCQCASLFQQPLLGGEIAAMMAEKLAGTETVDVVLAPAIGGILWGYELARALGVRSIFAERPTGEGFALRRGFAIQPGERVLIAEDVITTGKSALETVPLVESAGAVVAGFASIIDRSNGKFSPGKPFTYLTRLDFHTYDPGECPMCAAGDPVVKPGSRANPKVA